jgi:HD-GYP domain-containing protein (c-di-GMP phosphodiesterase class II)
MAPVKSGQSSWGSASGRKSSAQNILIPLETEDSNIITGFVVLDDGGFPEGGQRTLFDYAGFSFRESCANLSIHRELGDPTLEEGYLLTLLRLAQSIDHCNAFSRNHAVKTAFWARMIASELGFSENRLERIELASKLHDVGKIVVPKSILTKPAPLSEQEWAVMRRHPTFGAMIMKPATRLHDHIDIVKAHHENFDGTGYPLGLGGEHIPIESRIIAVADTYATMTEGRVYRLPSTSQDALREMVYFSGKQFDPEIVSVMIDLVTSGDVRDTQCRWERI